MLTPKQAIRAQSFMSREQPASPYWSGPDVPTAAKVNISTYTKGVRAENLLSLQIRADRLNDGTCHVPLEFFEKYEMIVLQAFQAKSTLARKRAVEQG